MLSSSKAITHVFGCEFFTKQNQKVPVEQSDPL